MKKLIYGKDMAGAPAMQHGETMPQLLPYFKEAIDYALIADQTIDRYIDGGKVLFEELLAIPTEQRIPALTNEFGLTKMHSLLHTIFNEFFASAPSFVTEKKRSDKSHAIASEVVGSAETDFLSFEDVIVFLHVVKLGQYGVLSPLQPENELLQMLEAYRNDRHRAYNRWKIADANVLNSLGPVARTANNPTPISELLPRGLVVSMSKKMSG